MQLKDATNFSPRFWQILINEKNWLMKVDVSYKQFISMIDRIDVSYIIIYYCEKWLYYLLRNIIVIRLIGMGGCWREHLLFLRIWRDIKL